MSERKKPKKRGSKKASQKNAGKKRRRRPGSQKSWRETLAPAWEYFKAGFAAGVDIAKVDIANSKLGEFVFDDREWASGARYAEALQILADRAARYLGRVSTGEDPVEALGGGPPEPGKN